MILQRINNFKFWGLIILIFLDISKTTIVPTGWILLGISMVYLFWIMNHRVNLHYGIFLISFGFLLINILASLFLGSKFDFLWVIRIVFTYILLSYILMKIYGFFIFKSLEKLIYLLTCLSLPMYFLNCIFKPLFDSMKVYFGPITHENLVMTTNYWSNGFYTNAFGIVNIKGLNFYRNSGFMWEPGYFALMIIIGLVISWSQNKPKFNSKNIVYFSALISTFSTAGYFAGLIMAVGAYFKKINLLNIVLTILLSLTFVGFIYQSTFIGGKIGKYLTAFEEGDFNYVEKYNAVKLNRFQIFIYDFERVFKYPIGFGQNDRTSFDNVNVTGTNGLSGLLRIWGIPFFIFFMALVYKFLHLANISGLTKIQIWFLYFAILTVFFSQNIQLSMLFYLIVLYPLSQPKKMVKRYE